MFCAWKAVNGNDTARSAFLVLLWIFVALSLLMVEAKGAAKEMQKNGRSVPVAFDIIYDIVMISGLAWYGWWWSAVGMFIIMATTQAVYEREIK